MSDSPALEPGVDRPLSGVTVAVTCVVDQPSELGREIERAGGESFDVPLIDIVAPDDAGQALRKALGRVRPGDWVAVTSSNGARLLDGALRWTTPVEGVRWAAVGTATATVLGETLAIAGWPIGDIAVPDLQRAEGLVALLCDRQPRGGRVVLALGNLAPPTLEMGLRDRGWEVKRVTAYRTVMCEVSPELVDRLAQADVLALMSGSAARALSGAGLIDNLPPQVFSVGPTTTAAATTLGVFVTATATDHGVSGMMHTLITHVGDLRRGTATHDVCEPPS